MKRIIFLIKNAWLRMTSEKQEIQFKKPTGEKKNAE